MISEIEIVSSNGFSSVLEWLTAKIHCVTAAALKISWFCEKIIDILGNKLANFLAEKFDTIFIFVHSV